MQNDTKTPLICKLSLAEFRLRAHFVIVSILDICVILKIYLTLHPNFSFRDNPLNDYNDK